jgi:hypothetical protein
MAQRSLAPTPALNVASGSVACRACRTMKTALGRIVLSTLVLGGWCVLAQAAPVV